jgi:glycosyltransferase involved in cell wall biosynthesis
MKKFRFLIGSLILILSFGFIGHSVYERFFHRPYLSVIGYVKMADGIGRQAVEVIDALREDIDIAHSETAPVDLTDVPEEVKKIISQKRERLGKVVLYEDVIWHPATDAYKIIAHPKEEDQIRIAYSMFESTRIPQKWVDIFNEYFDAVVVPDPFLVDVYKDSGVNLPVFVIPLGLNLDDFLNQPLKKQRNDRMVFANLSSGLGRKNQITLVRAFAKAFGNSPKVLLKINNRYAEEHTTEAIKAEIARLKLTNVEFTQELLDKESYLETFKNVDCYVSLSKGEGFSIQPREAMALGIPVIVSDSLAQETICKSALVKCVKADIAEPAYYHFPFKETFGFAYNCNVDDVAKAMKDVYKNYDKYLANGEQAREWVKQYRYEELKPFYKMLIKPERIVLGDKDEITEDYLMTASSELAEKYARIQDA